MTVPCWFTDKKWISAQPAAAPAALVSSFMIVWMKFCRAEFIPPSITSFTLEALWQLSKHLANFILERTVSVLFWVKLKLNLRVLMVFSSELLPGCLIICSRGKKLEERVQI